MKRRKLRIRSKRSKLAVSEVIGSIIMIAATLVVAFAAWAWASSSARASESLLNSSSVENFVAVSANFSSSNGKLVTLIIYSPSGASTFITGVIVQNTSWSYSNSTLSHSTGPNCKNCAQLTAQTMTAINLNIGTQFTKGTLYTFKITGEYGTVVQYQQVR